MSREALIEARDLIKAKRYDEARFILKSIDHPTAVEWLAKLDQIAPVAPTVSDNPFESPFDDPFASTVPQAAPRPPQPRPQPTPDVWVNDRTFGKPIAAKKNDPQLSNGVMILAVGGMLMVGAIILGIIVLLRGGGDDKKSASNDSRPTSIFNFSNEDIFELDMITKGELRYGDIQDDVVANSTAHIWTFQGTEGDHIDVAIQSTWDNKLQLRDSNGRLLQENDDQAGDFAGDARLYDISLPYTGSYQVVVRPWGFAGGSYRLWLSKLQ